MITLNSPRYDQYYEHQVMITKSIGRFQEGKSYNCKIMKCHKPDTRLMIFSHDAYAIGTKEELDSHFNES